MRKASHQEKSLPLLGMLKVALQILFPCTQKLVEISSVSLHINHLQVGHQWNQPPLVHHQLTEFSLKRQRLKVVDFCFK